jgi:hypothetical protein
MKAPLRLLTRDLDFQALGFGFAAANWELSAKL